MIRRLFALASLFVLTCAAAQAQPAPTPAPAPPEPAAPKLLRIGYVMDLFMGLSPQDAKAATRVWSEHMLNQKDGPHYKVDVVIFDTPEQLAESLKANAVEVFTCPSRDWLQWRDRLKAQLWGCSVYNEKQMTYLLVVNGDAGLHSLAELRGKRLVISPDDKGQVPETWLKVLLLRAGLPETESFFSSVKTVEKPDRALLPVFFGQADVCLVRRDALDLTAELNPQVGQRLQVLAESPFYLPGVFCIRSDFDTMDRDTLNRTFLAIHETAEGRQVLDLFRAQRTRLIGPGDLDSIAQLLAEYKSLHAHSSPGGPAQPSAAAPPPPAASGQGAGNNHD